MNIKKLVYSDGLSFLGGLSGEEKIKYLSVFGEHPFYLEMIDKTKSFEENIRNLLFNKFGNLVDAPDKVLPSSSKDQSTYNTILKAIAHRKRTNKEIAEYIGKEPNYVAAYLPKLVENEIIEKREAFNRNQKLNYYEISDNLIRFWYKFIFDNQGEILQNMGEIIFSELLPDIDAFVSKAFEDVAISWLTEKNINGELGHYYEVIRGYRADNSSLGRSVELDGLAKGIGKDKNRTLVVECKYRNTALSLSVLEHTMESLSIFPSEIYDVYLFSKKGFADDILSANIPNVHLVTVEEMTKRAQRALPASQ